jgi:hypothetical protein
VNLTKQICREHRAGPPAQPYIIPSPTCVRVAFVVKLITPKSQVEL